MTSKQYGEVLYTYYKSPCIVSLMMMTPIRVKNVWLFKKIIKLNTDCGFPIIFTLIFINAICQKYKYFTCINNNRVMFIYIYINMYLYVYIFIAKICNTARFTFSDYGLCREAGFGTKSAISHTCVMLFYVFLFVIYCYILCNAVVESIGNNTFIISPTLVEIHRHLKWRCSVPFYRGNMKSRDIKAQLMLPIKPVPSLGPAYILTTWFLGKSLQDLQKESRARIEHWYINARKNKKHIFLYKI